MSIRRLLLVVVFALVAVVPLAAQDGDTGGLPWWNDRVFYQIFVRSFYDSDGDGAGDIQGLIRKLDYLNDGDPATSDDLGITGIWLMPIMPSPSDHGYDVTDYTAINPDYGTMDDFRQFMDEAHARGIAVIIDLVLNHSSSEHPWFAASASGDPAFEDYYLWSEEHPGFNGPEGQNVWHRRGDRYYYGLFCPCMPDLNYTNPDVTAEIQEIVRFWLEDVGVDGFRVDAVKYIVEEGRATENTSSTHEWLRAFHDHVKSIDPDALLVGEIYDNTQIVLPYVPDEMDIAFEFDLAAAITRAAGFGLGGTMLRALEPVLAQYPEGQYATFTTNHDQDRLSATATKGLDSSRLGAYMLLTIPGVPFIYYGEELGMAGKRTLPATDNERRAPMQWDATAAGGFTAGTPWFDYAARTPQTNVADEAADPNSPLSAYRALIQLRSRTPALAHGDFTLLQSTSRRVIAFLRHTSDQTVLVLINPDDRPQTDYALSGSLPNGAAARATLLLGSGEAAAPTVGDDGTLAGYMPLPELPPYSVTVIELTA